MLRAPNTLTYPDLMHPPHPVQTDVFELEVAMAEVHSIRIGHDATGATPNWHLQARHVVFVHSVRGSLHLAICLHRSSSWLQPGLQRAQAGAVAQVCCVARLLGAANALTCMDLSGL